jgi:hypothetical protein
MKINKYIIAILTASSLTLTGFGVVGAQAATVNSPAGVHGPWSVNVLTQEGGRRQIESVKVDRDLVAWTEVDDQTGIRYLRVWNGMGSHTLASMMVGDWRGSDYYDAVEGNYDVADGVVVWVANDGYDNEIYAYRNGRVERVTDNSYDDRHPLTSEGRIVWTANMGDVYKLMVSDSHGVRAVDQYHVMNYVLSGSNLYWLNTVAGGDKMFVHRNSGIHTEVLGEAEVRPYDYDYLMTDGKGAVAWEVVYENRGNLGMHVVYGSDTGHKTLKLFERVRWLNEIQVEDVRGTTVLVNSLDVNSMGLNKYYLLHAGMSGEVAVANMRNMGRARFADQMHVRHELHETSSDASTLVVVHDDGSGGSISKDRIRLNMFEASGDTIAAAYHENGGLMLYANREVTRIPTDSHDVTVIRTSGNTTAFIYGEDGERILAVAAPTILVGNAVGTQRVSGRLVTLGFGQAVYLATSEGKRYVFPSEGQFYSWYRDFSSLQVLSAEEIAAMPLSGSVLYPSRTLLKTSSSPAVYAVGSDGRLHWVTDGLVLTMMYGNDWNRQVRDISASFITSYMMGLPVHNQSGYYSIAVTR